MITISEAKRLVQEHTPSARVETIPLAKAHGCTLAEDISAKEPSPRFTNSAMDGVTVRFAENTTAYKLIGESAAGNPFSLPFSQKLDEGDAVRISTGAVLPDGADTVIPIEDVEIQGENILVKKLVSKGQWVRVQGAEYPQGACVLRSQTALRPAHIALAAQCGYAELPVFAAPHLGLIATGTEIITQIKSPHPRFAHPLPEGEGFRIKPSPSGRGLGEGSRLREGQIYDANTPMLQAAIESAGGVCTMMHHVADSLQASIDALSEAANVCDIICTTGGVSVGEHDHIKEAAQRLGFETIFWRVRQKPGKPLFFAKRENTLLFGLPGNPVSTLMCFIHYVQPVIASMRGRTHAWRVVRARMSKNLVNSGGRAEFLRVRLEYSAQNSLPEISAMMPPLAIPLEKQESFMLTSLTEADGFVFLDIDAHLEEDAPIDVMLF